MARPARDLMWRRGRARAGGSGASPDRWTGRGGEGADASAIAGAAPDQAEPDRRQADDRDQDDVVAAQQVGRGCHGGWTISPRAASAQISWRLRVSWAGGLAGGNVRRHERLPHAGGTAGCPARSSALTVAAWRAGG